MFFVCVPLSGDIFPAPFLWSIFQYNIILLTKRSVSRLLFIHKFFFFLMWTSLSGKSSFLIIYIYSNKYIGIQFVITHKPIFLDRDTHLRQMQNSCKCLLWLALQTFLLFDSVLICSLISGKLVTLPKINPFTLASLVLWYTHEQATCQSLSMFQFMATHKEVVYICFF